MKPGVLCVLAVLAGSGALPVASADHMCGDAPFLPGVVSQYYDMWNNIWRYWACSHPADDILRDVQVRDVGVQALP